MATQFLITMKTIYIYWIRSKLLGQIYFIKNDSNEFVHFDQT